MTEQKMIDEMIDLQRKYDAAVCKEFNCTFDKEKTRLAMIDELGEFNHEVKKSWCWWKKTQKDIDINKTLEELVDVWHFVLSLAYHEFDETKDASPMLLMINTESRMNKCDLSKLYTHLMCETMTMFDTLYAIGKKFDFSMEDVYEAYKKKNQTNWERLASNY